MARTPAQAIDWAQGHVGKFGWDNLCLSFVRQSFGVDYVGDWPTSERQAGRAWDRAKHKHPETDPLKIPRGAPVFWELATEADHVALSLGDGWCLSNDFVVDGRIDRVRIGDIGPRWGGRLLGWTEDLVGNRVIPEQEPVTPMRVDGVDISHHQDGTINYAAAKQAGVKWLYHKATEGATYRDPNYTKRRAEAAKAGLPFGAYHFARAGVGDAEQEARAFLSYARPKPGDLRPALDLETTEGLSLTRLRTWAFAFAVEVVRQTGVAPIIYTPFDLGEDTKGCLIWRPRYNDSNTPPALPWDIWQFSNGVLGKPDLVAGFGHVDLNTMRKGLTLDDMLIPREATPVARRTLDVLTLNRGDHATYDAIRKAITGHALIALQEMHDSQSILDRLEADGFGVWRGNLEDAESNPVVWDPKLFTVHHRLSFPLLPAGRRAGKYNMAKTLNVVVGQHRASRRRVAFGSCHNIQSQYLPGRRKAAREFVRNMVDEASKFLCATIIGGDWNAQPDDYSLAPVRTTAGWGFDQARDELPTHGRRGIDGFAYTDRDAEPGVLRYVGNDPVYVPGTDHRGNSARFQLTVKESA